MTRSSVSPGNLNFIITLLVSSLTFITSNGPLSIILKAYTSPLLQTILKLKNAPLFMNRIYFSYLK